MRKPGTFLAATVAASFLASSCYTGVARPLPPPGEREGVAMRGVVLDAGSAQKTFEFSDMESALWSETSLTVTGAVNAPFQANHGRVETMSFPLADVSKVIVRKFDWTEVMLQTGIGVGLGVALLAYLFRDWNLYIGPLFSTPY